MRYLAALVLMFCCGGCAQLKTFGQEAKAAVCSAKETVKTGLQTGLSLAGLPGTVVGGVVGFGLDMVCATSGAGIEVATDPVGAVVGTAAAVAAPFTPGEPAPTSQPTEVPK